MLMSFSVVRKIATNEQDLWSGGEFETLPPERLSIQITDIELLTKVY